MKKQNIASSSAVMNATSATSSQNVTNAVTPAVMMVEKEETAYKKAQALINARRARALKWCTLRAICESLNSYDVISRRHFGVNAFQFARTRKASAELTVYGETFYFPVESTDTNTAARWLVAIEKFFGRLDSTKASEEARKLKAAANEAKALQTIAAAQGVDVNTLLAVLATLKH